MWDSERPCVMEMQGQSQESEIACVGFGGHVVNGSMSGWAESCRIGIAATRPGLFRSATADAGVVAILDLTWWTHRCWCCKPTQDFTASKSASLQHGCSLTDGLNEQTHPCFPSWYWEGGWSRWRSFCRALGNAICRCLLKVLESPISIRAASLHKLYYFRQWCCVFVKRTPSLGSNCLGAEG